MNIPAMDDLETKRVGMLQNDESGFSSIIEFHVHVDSDHSFGSSIPSRKRPFPYMIKSTTPTSVEKEIHTDSTLSKISQSVLEYTELLYESVESKEWVAELENFPIDDLTETEQSLCVDLQLHLTTDNSVPKGLWLDMYKGAYRRNSGKESVLQSDLFEYDPENRCHISYIPPRNDIHDWELEFYKETAPEQNIHSESLWLKYSRDGSSYTERPLIVFQSPDTPHIMCSPEVDYGSESTTVNPDVIESILQSSESQSELTDISPDQLQGTRTLNYLEAYIS